MADTTENFQHLHVHGRSGDTILVFSSNYPLPREQSRFHPQKRERPQQCWERSDQSPGPGSRASSKAACRDLLPNGLLIGPCFEQDVQKQSDLPSGQEAARNDAPVDEIFF